MILLKIDISISRHMSPVSSSNRSHSLVHYDASSIFSFHKQLLILYLGPDLDAILVNARKAPPLAPLAVAVVGDGIKSMFIPRLPDPILPAPRGNSSTHLPGVWGIAWKVSKELKKNLLLIVDNYKESQA